MPIDKMTNRTDSLPQNSSSSEDPEVVGSKRKSAQVEDHSTAEQSKKGKSKDDFERIGSAPEANLDAKTLKAQLAKAMGLDKRPPIHSKDYTAAEREKIRIMLDRGIDSL